jgi:hypothetical protein
MLVATVKQYTRKQSRQVWDLASIFDNGNDSKPFQLRKHGSNYTIDITIDDFYNNFVLVD